MILATRRIGVCVEGYFQRFGKFSTEDGTRKVSCKQFKDALGNLEELSWARHQPELVDMFYEAILASYENL